MLWIAFGLPDLQPFIHAAIDQHGLPGDVRSPFRCEPDNGLGDFAGFPQSFHWCIRGPAIENLLLAFARQRGSCRSQFLETIRRCETRANIVHQNSVFAKLVGEALNQPNHRRAHRV